MVTFFTSIIIKIFPCVCVEELNHMVTESNMRAEGGTRGTEMSRQQVG